MLGPGFVLTSKTKKSSSGKVMAKAMRYLDDDSVALVAREMAKELGDLVKASEEPYKHKAIKEGETLFETEDGGTCVICIGSTGTGKSSTIRVCTGRDVPSGSGRDRVTTKCAKYTDRHSHSPDDDIVWVDTVGWDDADLRDDSTFKDILRFIGTNSLLRVKAILWNILPNVRKDATLSNQAKMINMFKEKEIWKNVIIVCKQSKNPEEDAQGALAAAKTFNMAANVPVLGFTYLNDFTLTKRQREKFQDKDIREDFMVKTDEEVAALIHNAIQGLGDPIQVVFKNQKCQACSEVGDARLMSRFCHMEQVSIHSGSIIQYHPGKIERYHDSNTVIKEHRGGLYRPWYSCDFLLCKLGGDRYICCKALNGQPGCTVIRSCCKKPFIEGDDPVTGCLERYSCCKVKVDSRVSGCKSKYNCCDKKVKSKGCKDVCKKCDQPWGSPAGECFETSHTIVHLDKWRSHQGPDPEKL